MKSTLLTVAILATFSLPVLAQTNPVPPVPMDAHPMASMGKITPEPRAEMQKKWQSMSPAERTAMKKRMAERHAAWEKMTPEQRAKMKEKFEVRRDKMHEKWEEMTPEQKTYAKKQMEQRREKWESLTPEQRKAWAEKHHHSHVPVAAPAAPAAR